MRERGQSLIEMVVTLGVLTSVLAWAVPALADYREWIAVKAAARVFQADFRLARSTAVKRSARTAIRFERNDEGGWDYSVYQDGDYDGVQSRDIARGIDIRLSGPVRLGGGAPGVRIGILPEVPDPPPGSEPLDPDDPIRFGRSDMISFSTLGTATPGTLYLASRRYQSAVRVTGDSARVRVMMWYGHAWRTVQ